MISPPAQFHTPRLLLRTPVVEDAATIFTEYATDAEVSRYMTWTPHKSIETVRPFVEGVVERIRTGEEYSWILATPNNDTLLGMISTRVRGHKADLGYVLAREHWNQGYMTEAITVVTQWLLARPEIFRVWAVCDTENPGSARALEKANFEREGILRRWMMHPTISREPRDCYIYGRVR